MTATRNAGSNHLDWPRMKLKYLAVEIVDRLDAKPQDSAYVALENIESWSGRLLLDSPMQSVEGGVASFRAGDVLVGKLRPYLAKIARPTFDGVCSTELVVLRPTASVLPEFLQYRLLTPDFIEEVSSWTFGTKMPRVSPERLRTSAIALPSIEEQGAIVRFLDEETAKIDTLIDSKAHMRESLRTLLRAKIRLAIEKEASEANDVSLKRVAPFVTSGSRGWAMHYSNQGENFIRIGDLRADSIELNMKNVQKVVPPEGAEARRTLACAGDVLVSITALIGAVGVVPTDVTGYVNQHLALVRPDPNKVNSRWLALCLFSDVGQRQFQSALYGGTKQGLGLDDVREIRLPMPPTTQQERAVEKAELAMQQTVRASDVVEKGIRRLEEYRVALITAAVTGQIDVRKAA